MKTKAMKKALSLFLAVLMIALAIPFTMLTAAADEATEIEITKLSVFGRHSDDPQTKVFFQSKSDGGPVENAFDGDIETYAQTKNGNKRSYEMCYIDADGKMQYGANASGTSYYGIFIIELSDTVAVDTLSLWGIDDWGLEWMSNDGYDIYYSADGESYTAVNGASFENVCAKQSTADALYVAGTYNGKDGYVHDIAMGDVEAKYIAIAVTDYVPDSGNAQYKEMIFYEIVVTGTAVEEPIEPPVEEATERTIVDFSFFGRYLNGTTPQNVYFYGSYKAAYAYDKNITTDAQINNNNEVGNLPYEMCYIDADGVMRNGENPNGKSYYGMFVIELDAHADIDTVSLWTTYVNAKSAADRPYMANNGYDIYYSTNGKVYEAVDGATFSNVYTNKDTNGLYVAGEYNGKEGHVHEIDMKDVTAKYIVIAVSELVYGADEALVSEVVVKGTSPKLMLEDGASVRMSTPTGIRFTGYANKNYVDALKTETNEVTLGMLITPTEYLSNVDKFTKEALDNCNDITGRKYLEIDATTVLTDKDDYKINCAMVNVLKYNYDREFSAILYVKVTEGDTTEYIYSAYNKANNSRSIAYVASVALADVKDVADSSYKYPVTVVTGETKYSPYSDEDRATLESFSNAASPITVMTYNIKSENEGQTTENAYDTIVKINPDVVCLQEDETQIINAIVARNSDYKALKSDGNSDECNSILYNSKKFTVVQDGVVYYKDIAKNYSDNSAVAAADFGMDRENRFFRWAILKDSNGVEYLVVNTHLHYREGAKNEWPDYYDNDPHSDANKAVRVAQIALLKLWLSEQTVENQIVVGDMNCHITSDVYRLFASGERVLDSARDDAIFKGDVGGTDTNDYVERNEWIWDHILYGDSTVVALEYSVIDNAYENEELPYPSDHLPVYAKFIAK